MAKVEGEFDRMIAKIGPRMPGMDNHAVPQNLSEEWRNPCRSIFSESAGSSISEW